MARWISLLVLLLQTTPSQKTGPASPARAIGSTGGETAACRPTVERVSERRQRLIRRGQARGRHVVELPPRAYCR
jgi:hypothetical protein